MKLEKAKRYMWVSLGIVSLALGAIGLFLPILPTVPFIILAAWCFGKGSKKLQNKILNHNKYGPIVKAYQKNKIIPLRIKRLATIAIIISFSISIYLFFDNIWPRLILPATAVAVLIFIWKHPSEAVTQSQSLE